MFPGGMIPQFTRFPPPKGSYGSPVDRSFYDILKVPVTFTEPDVLRKAYRELSIKHHPDKGGDRDKYQEIVNAYSILSDPEKRVCYDAYGKDYEKVPNLQMFLQHCRPEDLEIQLRLPLHECIKGKQFEYTYNILRGKLMEKKEVAIHIPPNVQNGHRIVMPGKGHIDPKKPLPGSLVIVVLEVRDPSEKCKRIGNVVLFQTKIPLKDALCGYPIPLTLPDKSNVVFAQNIIHPAQWYKLSNTNFYISFEIVYPNEIDANTQDQFRKLFGLKTDKSIVTHELEKIETSKMDQVIEEQHMEQRQQSQQPNVHVQECRQQ